jgi:hypothetical protein
VSIHIAKFRDEHNLLQNSEIKFLNQVQGPESIVFDPLGRGPYTGHCYNIYNK